jgi:hypothetical protein
VHLTLGILRQSQAFSYALSFFWLDGFAVPAPAQVTHAVGRLANIMNKNLFEKSVNDNFRYLQEKYGFSTAVTEDFGREIFIRYERNYQTVSISYEYGSSPLIEIFYPSIETGDRPVPWASKNNVQRSRRFSKTRPKTRFSDDETSIEKYIEEIAFEFEKIESKWLEARQSI